MARNLFEGRNPEGFLGPEWPRWPWWKYVVAILVTVVMIAAIVSLERYFGRPA
jgi:hypothetical protein